MNYQGIVSSVNNSMWTFVLDEKVTVYMGHLAAFKPPQYLPELGERVVIYNAHVLKVKRCSSELKLFLCEESLLECSWLRTYAREEELLEIIKEHSLGVSDLYEIDRNLTVVEHYIKPLAEQSLECIAFELLRCLSNKGVGKRDSCLNRTIAPLTLKTVSKCRYVDLQPVHKHKVPPWSFGTHSKVEQSDRLLGFLQVNKRYGVILLHDVQHKLPCLVTSKNRSRTINDILNKLVIIDNYRVFTELFRERDVQSLEYVLFDIDDVVALNVNSINKSIPSVFFDQLPDDHSYLYHFHFKLIEKFTPNVSRDDQIECWLEVLIDEQHSYLCLNAYQVHLLPVLRVGATYQTYHSRKLCKRDNIELLRIKPLRALQKFAEATAVFVFDRHGRVADPDPSVLTVSEVLARIKDGNAPLSFQGLLSVKKLTPALSSRTEQFRNCAGFGTSGSQTHTLFFEDKLYVYLNNWENLLLPLGLVPHMRVCIRNALPQKGKYLKSCAATTVEILSYEPPVPYDTANLCSDPSDELDSNCYLGWGNLIPSGVLIWSVVKEVYVRSLKVTYKCADCGTIEGCDCESKRRVLETSITLYTFDEMGQALVISNSVELLSLLLGFDPSRWKVWCEAFESLREYVHDARNEEIYSEDTYVNGFCEALNMLIRAINARGIVDLEFKCRKFDVNNEDNEGMPVWYCINARKKGDAIV